MVYILCVVVVVGVDDSLREGGAPACWLVNAPTMDGVEVPMYVGD